MSPEMQSAFNQMATALSVLYLEYDHATNQATFEKDKANLDMEDVTQIYNRAFLGGAVTTLSVIARTIFAAKGEKYAKAASEFVALMEDMEPAAPWLVERITSTMRDTHAGTFDVIGLYNTLQKGLEE